jgi:DNA-binding CsgD family transcriptional regulator
MIGREQEIEWLVAFLSRATVHGKAAVVIGEPGIGKTLLLDALTERAAELGVRVLRSSGVEFEADLGFSGLHQLLLPVLPALGKLFGVQREALEVALALGSGSTPDRLLVSTAALALLQHGVAPHGALFVVDDAHWLDHSSSEAIAFMARRLTGTRIGLVVACRSGHATVFERSGLDELEIGPLGDNDAVALVEDRFPTLPHRVRSRLLADAHGNPLALLELPWVLSAEQRAAARPLPDILPLTERLQALFASRLAKLSDPTRRFLLLVALDGRHDLREGLAVGAPLVVADLMAAEEARLVQLDAVTGRVAFRHPLIRSALVEFATLEERREAHRELARQCADRPDERAWHLAAATEVVDESVASLLEASARRLLRRGDTTTAVAALTKAAGLSPSAADRSRRLAEAAFVEAHVAGDMRQVRSLLDEARISVPGAARSLSDVAAEAFLLLRRDGDVAAAARHLSRAIAANTSEGLERGGQASAIWALYPVCVAAGRPDLWRLFQSQVVRFKDEVPPALALHARAGADPARASAEVLAELDRALVDLEEAADPVHIVTLGAVASTLDRIESCRDAVARVVQLARDGNAAPLGIAAAIVLSRWAFDSGEWDAVDDFVDEGLALCELSDDQKNQVGLLHYRALVAGARGDASTAIELADRASRWLVPRGMSTAMVHWVRCTAALGRGDFDSGYREAVAISPPGSFAPYVPVALAVPFDLVEAAVRTHRREQALVHARAMEHEHLARISPRLAMVSLASAAMASDALDKQLFEKALAVPLAERWPFTRSRMQLAYGERLRRDHQPAKARDHLAAALDTFELLRAAPWAERARSELRAAGVGTSHTSRPLARGLMLTTQEQEIALLASEGLSNKEIAARLYLSPRTVGAHLYRIFPKLGITSRSALRRALEGLGSGDL